MRKHKKIKPMVRLKRLAALLNDFVEKDLKMEDLFDPLTVDHYWKLLEENLWGRKMESADGHDRWSLIWVLYEMLKGVWDRFNKAREGLIFPDHDSLFEREMRALYIGTGLRDKLEDEDGNDPSVIPYERIFEADLIMLIPRLRRCKDDQCHRWFALPKKLRKEGDRWVTVRYKREKEYCCQRHASRYYQKMKRTENREKYNEDMREYRAKQKSSQVSLKNERNKT